MGLDDPLGQRHIDGRRNALARYIADNNPQLGISHVNKIKIISARFFSRHAHARNIKPWNHRTFFRQKPHLNLSSNFQFFGHAHPICYPFDMFRHHLCVIGKLFFSDESSYHENEGESQHGDGDQRIKHKRLGTAGDQWKHLHHTHANEICDDHGEDIIFPENKTEKYPDYKPNHDFILNWMKRNIHTPERGDKKRP